MNELDLGPIIEEDEPQNRNKKGENKKDGKNQKKDKGRKNGKGNNNSKVGKKVEEKQKF